MNSLLATILAPLVLVATLCAGRAVMCATRADRQPSARPSQRIALVSVTEARNHAMWN